MVDVCVSWSNLFNRWRTLLCFSGKYNAPFHARRWVFRILRCVVLFAKCVKSRDRIYDDCDGRSRSFFRPLLRDVCVSTEIDGDFDYILTVFLHRDGKVWQVTTLGYAVIANQTMIQAIGVIFIDIYMDFLFAFLFAVLFGRSGSAD